MSVKNYKKFTPSPLAEKCPYWLDFDLSCPVRTHHKFWKILIFAPKSADVRIWRTPLSAKYPHWTNSPSVSWVRTSVMVSPLHLMQDHRYEADNKSTRAIAYRVLPTIWRKFDYVKLVTICDPINNNELLERDTYSLFTWSK